MKYSERSEEISGMSTRDHTRRDQTSPVEERQWVKSNMYGLNSITILYCKSTGGNILNLGGIKHFLTKMSFFRKKKKTQFRALTKINDHKIKIPCPPTLNELNKLVKNGEIYKYQEKSHHKGKKQQKGRLKILESTLG